MKPLGEGQGFVSVVYRVTVDFDDGDASPYSFVLKVPSTRHVDTFASETDNPEVGLLADLRKLSSNTVIMNLSPTISLHRD